VTHWVSLHDAKHTGNPSRRQSDAVNFDGDHARTLRCKSHEKNRKITSAGRKRGVKIKIKCRSSAVPVWGLQKYWDLVLEWMCHVQFSQSQRSDG